MLTTTRSRHFRESDYPEIPFVAQKQAALLLNRLWDDNFPVDTFLIAERLGVTVFQERLSEDAALLLHKAEGAGEPVKLFISTRLSSRSARVACAQALGYLINITEGHHPRSYAPRVLIDPVRGEAKSVESTFSFSFALALLLPPSAVVGVIEQNPLVTLREVADAFGVPIGLASSIFSAEYIVGAVLAHE